MLPVNRPHKLPEKPQNLPLMAKWFHKTDPLPLSLIHISTTEHSKSSTEDFAADYFDDVFGPHDNGTIFVIDRCLNEIYLYSDGQAHKIITNSRARSITDNTYTYARDKDYYTCAYKVFAQIETLMQGKRIAEPMRYLCSALLAIVAALFLNLFFALWSSRSHKADRRQVMTGLYAQMQIHNPRTQFINQTRTYSCLLYTSNQTFEHTVGTRNNSGLFLSFL